MKDKIKEKYPDVGYHDELEYVYMFDSDYY